MSTPELTPATSDASGNYQQGTKNNNNNKVSNQSSTGTKRGETTIGSVKRNSGRMKIHGKEHSQKSDS